MAFKRIMERAGIKGRLLRETNGAGALAHDAAGTLHAIKLEYRVYRMVKIPRGE
jgi:hypothetical protein